jgi:DegV family protein with EDD domain
MSTAIVTDSTADLPPDLSQALHIQIIPAILIIDNQNYLDGEGISRRSFYERLPAMQTLPTTAAPAPGQFELIYEHLLSQGADQVVSLHVGSRFSSIYNVASVAAKNFAGRVQTVDSGTFTLGLGFQALAAAEMAQAGQPVSAILDACAATRQRLRVLAMLHTFEFARRSGRVSWLQAQLGSLLNIKPVLEVKDNTVLRLGQVRTRHKGLDHVLALLEAMGPLERLAVLHTNAEEDAHNLLARLTSQPATPPMVVNVTTIIGTHVGPQAVGFAAVRTQ